MNPGPSATRKQIVYVAAGVVLFAAVFTVVHLFTKDEGEVVADLDAIRATERLPPAVPTAPTPPGPVAGTSVVDAPDGPCRVAVAGDSPVARACAQGGTGQAKKEMKRLVVAAKNQGTVFACDSCHEVGTTEHDLVDDARDKFKQLLAAAAAAEAPAAEQEPGP